MKLSVFSTFFSILLFGSSRWPVIAFNFGESAEPASAVPTAPLGTETTSSSSISSSALISLLPEERRPTHFLSLPVHNESSKKLAYIDPKVSYYMMIILLEKLVPEGNVIYMILEDPTLIGHYCTVLCDDPYNCPCPSENELKDLDVQHVYMCVKRCQHLPHEVDTYLLGDYGHCWRNCISSFVEFIPPTPTTTRSYWSPTPTPADKALQSGLAHAPTTHGKQDVEYTLGTPEDEEDFNLEPAPKEQKGATPEVGPFIPPAVRKFPTPDIDSNSTAIVDSTHYTPPLFLVTELTLVSDVIEEIPSNFAATAPGGNHSTHIHRNMTMTLVLDPTLTAYVGEFSTDNAGMKEAVNGACCPPRVTFLVFFILLGPLIM